MCEFESSDCVKKQELTGKCLKNSVKMANKTSGQKIYELHTLGIEKWNFKFSNPLDFQGVGSPGGPVKYDFVHMLDQAFSKQPLNKFCSLPKNDP